MFIRQEAVTIKRDEKLTFGNWVTIDGQPTKVLELPEKIQHALGNRARREPPKALGFIVEECVEAAKTG